MLLSSVTSIQDIKLKLIYNFFWQGKIFIWVQGDSEAMWGLSSQPKVDWGAYHTKPPPRFTIHRLRRGIDGHSPRGHPVAPAYAWLSRRWRYGSAIPPLPVDWDRWSQWALDSLSRAHWLWALGEQRTSPSPRTSAPKWVRVRCVLVHPLRLQPFRKAKTSQLFHTRCLFFIYLIFIAHKIV